MTRTAKALWIPRAGEAEYREEVYPPSEGALEIKMLFSGISRGTERLVFEGRVPETEHETMRAPFQAGAFTFPVKYGYAAVGKIQSGPRVGEAVFALYPHQTGFMLPPEAVVPLPVGVPPARAVLAANMETALTVTWDAHIGVGDRVTVIGCGVVGALIAYLTSRIPGTEVTILDLNPDRKTLADLFGCRFATPDALPEDADVVVHASASAVGLSTAIETAGMEARIIEASWFGSSPTELLLGGRFHQRRLRLISSQVGRIPADRAPRWTYRRRLSKALDLLVDPALDHLISGETSFEDLAASYGAILADPATLCHRVRYSA